MTTLKRQSSLGRARGHGSAKSGSQHWILQRMTSIGLVFLGAWFFWGVMTHDLSNYQSAVLWLQNPFNMALMTLTLAISLFHGYLGLHVVIEDYIHNEGVKILSLVFMRLVFTILVLASLYSLVMVQSISVMTDLTQANLAMESLLFPFMEFSI